MAELDSRILDAVESLLDGSEFEVVDVMCVGAPRGFTVQVLVDRVEGNITIEECAKLSRAVGDHLDQESVIDGQYVLELSSPGIDRPLRRAKDYVRFAGERVKITTFEKIDERHQHVGVLAGLDEEGGDVLLDTEEHGRMAIPLDAVKKSRLVRDPWAAHRDRKPRSGSRSERKA